MDNNIQDTIKYLEEKIKVQDKQSELEIKNRSQAEESLKALTEELNAVNAKLASFEKNAEERIRFNILLSEISAKFITLPSDQIDTQIEEAQRRFCEFFGIDMCTLWQWIPEKPEELLLTHLYRPLGGPPIPRRMEASRFFPKAFQHIKEGKTSVISSIDNVPPEAAQDLESWRQYGIKTTVRIPLSTGNGPTFGAITFNDLQTERKWSETMVERLHLVAQIFANALSRKRYDEILQESEKRLTLATNAAGAGLWIMDIDTEKIWVSDKLRELIGFASDEEINYQDFIEKIHPDDRERINLDVQKSIESGESLLTDYRVILPDGYIRWINARGHCHRQPGENQYRLMGASIDTTERKMLENQLEENLYFGELLTEISTHFINLPPDKVDTGIKEAQRRVCECLGLDVSAVWQWTVDDPDRLILTHLYRTMEGPPVPENLDAKEFFPWCQQELRAGRVIAVSCMDNLPPEAAQDKEAWRQFEVKTSLIFPLSTGSGPPFGGISFNDMKTERNWSETIVKRLQLVAQIFANALARRRSDEILRESEMRLAMATDAAGAGLWAMDIINQEVWVSGKLRELFCFAANERINYSKFFEKIHPDDQQLVHREVEQAIRSNEYLHCDFRIMLPDGGIRWICSRGNRQLHPIGENGRLMGVSVDITERMQAEQDLEDRLRFERLLSDISKRFVNQSIDGIDREIEAAQRLVCEFFDIDLAAVWQWMPGSAPGFVTLTHFYRADEGPRLADMMIAQKYFPWAQQQVIAGHVINVPSVEELPAEAALDLDMCRYLGIKSNLTIPLSVGGELPIGAFGLNATREQRHWSEELVGRLQMIAQIFANAIKHKRMNSQLLAQLQEIKNLKERLENENLYLQNEIKYLGEHEKFVGQSLAMKRILAEAAQVAITDSTVLILGETGTGKEMLARLIHQMSDRKARPMITINCASIPPTLIESELFGREKGAYTGAMTRMVGRFEVADGSTLFLDEIGELPMELQGKLLRVLEEGVFERLGSSDSVRVNVRVLAATNRDIESEVEKGRFRKDLYYRLNVFPIMIPPLRQRSEDIPLLVWTFVKEFKNRMGKEVETISKKIMETLQSYPWPGNVRELRNIIERAMILSNSPSLVVQFPKAELNGNAASKNLDDFDREHIVSVLERNNWRVSRAAEILGLKRSTLYSKMKKLEIIRPN